MPGSWWQCLQRCGATRLLHDSATRCRSDQVDSVEIVGMRAAGMRWGHRVSSSTGQGEAQTLPRVKGQESLEMEVQRKGRPRGQSCRVLSAVVSQQFQPPRACHFT